MFIEFTKSFCMISYEAKAVISYLQLHYILIFISYGLSGVSLTKNKNIFEKSKTSMHKR